MFQLREIAHPVFDDGCRDKGMIVDVQKCVLIMCKVFLA